MPDPTTRQSTSRGCSVVAESDDDDVFAGRRGAMGGANESTVSDASKNKRRVENKEFMVDSGQSKVVERRRWDSFRDNAEGT